MTLILHSTVKTSANQIPFTIAHGAGVIFGCCSRLSFMYVYFYFCQYCSLSKIWPSVTEEHCFTGIHCMRNIFLSLPKISCQTWVKVFPVLNYPLNNIQVPHYRTKLLFFLCLVLFFICCWTIRLIILGWEVHPPRTITSHFLFTIRDS